MDESFDIVSYDPTHINVRTDPHTLPVIEPGSLSPTAILEKEGKTSAFELLTSWSESLEPDQRQSTLYPIPYGTKWEDIPPTVKEARLASLIGLHIPERYGALSPELINQELSKYEKNVIETGLRDFAHTVANDWNTLFAGDANTYPLPRDAAERCFFLPHDRLQELKELPFFGTVTDEGEVLVPIDDELTPPNSDGLYTGLAHELTHLARLNKLDNIGNKGEVLHVTPDRFQALERLNRSVWMIEGIAQIAAKKLTASNHRHSNPHSAQYDVECVSMEIMQKALDISDKELINIPITKLIDLVNNSYSPNPLNYTAFDELCDDVELLKRIYEKKNTRPMSFEQKMEQFVERWYPEFFKPALKKNK